MEASESPAPVGAGDGAHDSCTWRNDQEFSGSWADAQVHELHYGTGRTPLVGIVPDNTYPSMWRVIWPGGVSDIVNLARAKDAALAICERGPPLRNRARLHWHLNRSERPPKPVQRPK